MTDLCRVAAGWGEDRHRGIIFATIHIDVSHTNNFLAGPLFAILEFLDGCLLVDGRRRRRSEERPSKRALYGHAGNKSLHVLQRGKSWYFTKT